MYCNFIVILYYAQITLILVVWQERHSACKRICFKPLKTWKFTVRPKIILLICVSSLIIIFIDIRSNDDK